MNFIKGHISFAVQRFITISQREQDKCHWSAQGHFITTLASETTKVEGIEKVLGTRGQGGSLRNGVFWTQKDLCGCELTADMVT